MKIVDNKDDIKVEEGEFVVDLAEYLEMLDSEIYYANRKSNLSLLMSVVSLLIVIIGTIKIFIS